MFRVLVLLLSASIAAHGQSAVFQWVKQMGGSGGQAIAGMTTDAQGNVYVVGNTTSLDFPVKSAYQPRPGGSGLYRIDGPGSAWQSLSSAGMTSVSHLAANPANPSTIFATEAAGLRRSTDGGATWAAVGSFGNQVTGVALDPNGLLYVSTIQGLFKSTDGGASFAAINNGIVADTYGRLYFLRIWVDPLRPSVVFAMQNSGLMRSADSGASWQPVPQFDVFPTDLSFDPNTPGAVYATSSQAPRKSTDDGLTWTALQPAPPPYSTVGSLLVDPKHPGTLYGSAYSSLWKSTDDGQTWVAVQNQQVGVLAADPVSGALYAALGAGIAMSTDGFQTVTPVGPPALPGIATIQVIDGRVFAGVQASTDVFVAKLDPQGNTIYATYLGGAAGDAARAMAVDSTGAVYVAGNTNSLDFPVSAGAFARTGASFVFKLMPDGSLGYSTYFASTTTPYALAVDTAGHVYVTGVTNGNLPVTAGVYQNSLQGSYPGTFFLGPGPPPITNAFLAELDPAGSSLLFSTYIGSFTAYANVIALDGAGGAFLAGGPTLYHVSAGGTSLLKTGGLKGTVWALTMDSNGNLLAGGESSGGFPTTPGAFQTARRAVPSLPGLQSPTGGSVGFVARLDSDFNILASTLLSGEVDDRVLCLAVTSDGNIVAGGTTASKAFPTRGPVQSDFGHGTGFITTLTPDLSRLVYSTFTGDTRAFIVRSVAATPDGGAVLGGATTNPPYYSSYGSFDPSLPTDSTVQSFVVRVGLAPAMPRIDAVANAASLLPVALSPGGTLQVTGEGFGDDATLLVNGSSLPLLSKSRTALVAVAPADLNAPGAATVQVLSGGGASNSVLTPVSPAAPGVFSADGSGVGQGYILNEDGTLNSPTNPAKEGSAITISLTGMGALTFVGDYAVTASPVNVYVDGFYADGIGAHVRTVAGLPGSVYQISVYVPRPSDFADVNPNLQGFVMPPQVAVTVEVGGIMSQAGLALSVGH